jgi:hypothetical protein
MLALAVDENFNNDTVRGILRRKPDLNIVRVQDAGLSGAEDPTVLEWAARQRRVIFTHDASTMTHHAYNAFGTVSLCQAYLKSIVEFRSLRLLKTFYCWRNAVLKVSGKVKYAICRW